LALGLVAAFAACTVLPPDDHRVVDRWLLCDECTAGELDSVRLLGSTAVPRLATALIDGPTLGRRKLMREKSTRSYVAIQPPPTISQADYVNDLVSNYLARYQQRAASALAAIGGVEARDVLDEALGPGNVTQYRADVVRAIRFARSGFDVTPYPGQVTPASVGVGDTVRVASKSGGVHTGDELAALDGAAFAPADVLISVQPSQLLFLAASPLGRHALDILNAGNTSNAERTSLSISTELDPNDRATLGCVLIGCLFDGVPTLVATVLPHLSVLTLRKAPSPVDTSDVFKVRNLSPASPMPVTAHLDWPAGSAANLDLRWTECVPPYSAVGNSSGATLARPEVTSVSIPVGDCWGLTVRMVSGGTGRVFAKLRVTSP
jgi:hypothetical protein